MLASELIPSPDAIPVAWGWLEGLLLVTFVIHILLMNVVVGGTILSVIRSIWGPPSPAVFTTGKKLPTVLALAVNFGVAPLLFIQMLYGQFMYTSSVLMAAYWLGIVAMLIVAYYGLYIFVYKADSVGSRWALRISCLLMLTIAFLFTNNMTLMLHPERWLEYFASPSGTILVTSDKTFFPRWLHFMTAAVAVGGLFQAVLYDWKLRRSAPISSTIKNEYTAHRLWGMRLFAWGSAAQIGVGGMFLFSLPQNIRVLFLGGENLHTGGLIIALAGVAILLHYAFRNRVWPCVWATIFTVFAMSIVRALLRGAYLKPYFSVTTLPVLPEYSPMILFFGVLGICVCVMAYMVKLAVRSGKAGGK